MGAANSGGGGLLSALVHGIAVVNIWRDDPIAITGWAWWLHVAALVLFFVALKSKGRRAFLRREETSETTSEREKNKYVVAGVPKVIWVSFVIYTLALMVLSVLGKIPNNVAEPWLLFSSGWMGFSYFCWAVLHEEAAERTLV